MSELVFFVRGARVEPHAAQPTLALKLAIEERQDGALEGLALQCQLRLEPQRRDYSADEERALVDLFSAPSRWSTTVKPMSWLETATFVPAFTGRTEVELLLACSSDLDVSAAKYFHGLQGGDIPLRLLFRGTIFTRADDGLQMTPLPWDREATWRLPVALWRAAIDSHFPDAGWLRLRKQTLGDLLAFKGRHALPSWDGVMEKLLAAADR